MGVPSNSESRGVLDPAESTSDSAIWRDFAEAASPEAFYRGWLAIQCRMIPGVGIGVIFAAPSPGARFAPTASWPEGRRTPAHLGEAAEQALTERRGIVLKREAGDDSATPGRDRYDVAYPIQADGNLYGVVALDIAPRPERDLEAVLRQLQWGAGWLELLAHRLGTTRLEPASAEAARQRLQTVLDLLTSALGTQRFYGAASAFVTALATRLACERVSIGFVKGGRARVRAVSHSAHFGKQTNLVRAIGAAMDEAIDQHGTVVYPALPGRTTRVVRAHAELARHGEPGAICTIPMIENRRFVGALTRERPAERPFDAMTIDLCEVLAAVAGPVLEVQRRDDRWLAVKAGDTAWRHLKAVIGPQRTGLKLGVVAFAAVVAVLALARGEYRVSAHRRRYRAPAVAGRVRSRYADREARADPSAARRSDRAGRAPGQAAPGNDRGGLAGVTDRRGSSREGDGGRSRGRRRQRHVRRSARGAEPELPPAGRPQVQGPVQPLTRRVERARPLSTFRA